MPGWQHHKPKPRRDRRIRPHILERDPICRCDGCHRCSTPNDCRRPSTEDDHITPLNQGGSDTDPNNHRGICTPCHSVKTAREGRRARGTTRRQPETHPGLG